MSDLKYNYLDDYDRFTHRALFEFSDATTYSRIETQKFTFSRKQPLALLKKNINIISKLLLWNQIIMLPTRLPNSTSILLYVARSSPNLFLFLLVNHIEDSKISVA